MGRPEQALPGLDDGVRLVGRFEWERLIRRARLGFYRGGVEAPGRWVRHATVQHVALLLATYADLDGTRVRPTALRVATVGEIDERTVRACVGRLHELGLLRLVAPHRSPGRRGGEGRAAEYRMTDPGDLLGRLAHLDPDEHDLIVPEGAAMPPERKPRRKEQPDAALWTTDQDPN